MTQGKSSGSKKNPVLPRNRKRTVPRFNFVATTELIDSATQTHLSGRISEISRKGCYVDIYNPLPVGTPISVLITHGQGSFVTRGKIVYIHEGIGMGVEFVEPSNEQMRLLDSWLAALQKN